MKIVFKMSFFTFSNADIQFADKKLTWRTYTIKEALPITYQIELIDKKRFAKAALDENVKAFVVHVSSLSLRSKITIYLTQKTQITLLFGKEVIVPLEFQAKKLGYTTTNSRVWL